MPKPSISEVRIAASMMASDADLCRRYGLTQEQLEKYRDVIETGRAAESGGGGFA